MLMEAPVVMVGMDSVEVERRLSAGELACPCGGGLAPWGYARRAAGPWRRACCGPAGPAAAAAGSRMCCWRCRACCAGPTGSR